MIRNPKTGRFLKNPERYIARLQAQLGGALHQKEHYRRLYNESGGSVILNGGGEHTAGCRDGVSLINLEVGDVIARLGRVTSIRASKCENGNKESSMTYKTLQTRKMPRDFIY